MTEEQNIHSETIVQSDQDSTSSSVQKVWKSEQTIWKKRSPSNTQTLNQVEPNTRDVQKTKDVKSLWWLKQTTAGKETLITSILFTVQN